MKPLNAAERRALKARAHTLRPVAMVSGAGLADSVLAEIERCLKAHELIKIRVTGNERPQREELLARICERTGAAPVQHIGKVLVVYRKNPEPPQPGRTPAARLKSKRKATVPPSRRPGAPSRGTARHAPARPRSSPRAASRRRP